MFRTLAVITTGTDQPESLIPQKPISPAFVPDMVLIHFLLGCRYKNVSGDHRLTSDY